MTKLLIVSILLFSAAVIQTTFAYSPIKSNNTCFKEISRHNEIREGDKSLFLYQCNLNDSDVDYLKGYIHTNHITRINLRDNNLSGIGLANLLNSNDLYAIDIGSNKIKRDEFHNLIETIKQHGVLREIDLYGDHVPPQYILALLSLPHLTALKLADNDVKDETVLAILSAKKITTLDISFNHHISIKSINALAEDMKITDLDLSFDDLTPEEINRIKENKNIISLGLEGNMPCEF